jgi:putative membrane protein
MISRHLLRASVGVFALGVTCTTFARSATNSLTSADSSFMKDAAADGMAEVRMGRMALDKSADAGVKALAQRIVDDHTRANDQLESLAARKQTSLPAAPTADAQREGQRLMAMKGSAFDRAWAKDMVSDHQKAVKLFTSASTTATDSEVKAFAGTTLPTLKTHLQMAEQLSTPSARDKAMDHAMPEMDHTQAPMNPPVAPPPATMPASATTSAAPDGTH